MILSSLLVALILSSGRLLILAQEIPAVRVTRNGTEDVFEGTRITPEGSCERIQESCPTYFTYLVEALSMVEESGECVNDTVLQRMSCSVQLVPADGSFTTNSISSFIAEDGSLMVLNSVNRIYDVGRLFNHQNVRQNGQNCVVTGLNVVRGTENITRIDQSGFMATGGLSISINVNYSELAYERSDYDGEVYRIDMMCDSNTAVDCVFIKLNGVADLTRAKFADAVPAISDPCSSTTTTTMGITTAAMTPGPPSNTTSTQATDTISKRILDDKTCRSIIIGLGVGLGFMLCLTLILCIGICCLFWKYARVEMCGVQYSPNKVNSYSASHTTGSQVEQISLENKDERENKDES